MACSVLGTEDSESPRKLHLSWDSKVREKFPHGEAAGRGGVGPREAGGAPCVQRPWTSSVLQPTAASSSQLSKPSQGSTGLTPRPPEGHPCPLLSLFSEKRTWSRLFPLQTRKAKLRKGADRIKVTQLVRSRAGARTQGSQSPAPDGLPNHTRNHFLICSSHRHRLSSQLTHVSYNPPATQTYTLAAQTPSAITREKEGGWASGQPDDRPASVSGLVLAATLQPRLPGQTASRLMVRLRRTPLLTAHTPTIHAALCQGACKTRRTCSAAAASPRPSLEDAVVKMQRRARILTHRQRAVEIIREAEGRLLRHENFCL